MPTGYYFGRLANGLKVTTGAGVYTGNKYVQLPNLTINPTTPFTIVAMLWVSDINNVNRVFCQTDGGGNPKFVNMALYSNHVTLDYLVSANTGTATGRRYAQSAIGYTTSQRIMHIAASTDGNVNTSGIKLYANGVKLGAFDNSINTLVDGTVISSIETDLGFETGGYIFSFLYFNTQLSDADILSLNILENRPVGSILSSLERRYDFREKNGLVLNDLYNGSNNGTLLHYTNAETASSGQPQSGNTAWVDAYTQLPITV